MKQNSSKKVNIGQCAGRNAQVKIGQKCSKQGGPGVETRSNCTKCTFGTPQLRGKNPRNRGELLTTKRLHIGTPKLHSN